MAGKTFTMEEVRKHNDPDHDAWIVIKNRVYAIHGWVDEHPGGRRRLVDWLGRDATDAFALIGHSMKAIEKLKTMEIGVLKAKSSGGLGLPSALNSTLAAALDSAPPPAPVVRSQSAKSVKSRSASGDSRTFTMAEVKKHDKESDCWIVMEGRVYDVTHWLQRHPGGSDRILLYAGKDASDAFGASFPASRLSASVLDLMRGRPFPMPLPPLPACQAVLVTPRMRRRK